MNRSTSLPRKVLSIAGSDSGGGAGIQADLKAFARCGVHGMTAVTAVTAQNTVAVTAVEPLSPEIIVEQVRAVAEDIGVDAVKIGMLGTVETIEAVGRALDLVADAPVVLDPVMVAESGARLLDSDAEDALRERLLPRVTVVTPNVLEARVLTCAGSDADAAASVAGTASSEGGPASSLGGTASSGSGTAFSGGGAPSTRGGPAASTGGIAGAGSPDDAEHLARALHALGPAAVVVTGGHRETASDLFFDGIEVVEITGERHPAGAAHGSGCTHSSVLAAQLALGREPLEAARIAKQIAAEAVRDGLRGLGAGAGPVDVLGRAAR